MKSLFCYKIPKLFPFSSLMNPIQQSPTQLIKDCIWYYTRVFAQVLQELFFFQFFRQHACTDFWSPSCMLHVFVNCIVIIHGEKCWLWSFYLLPYLSPFHFAAEVHVCPSGLKSQTLSVQLFHWMQETKFRTHIKLRVKLKFSINGKCHEILASVVY